jgi:glutathione-regulated potassium-efflux system ancillary protein KefG
MNILVLFAHPATHRSRANAAMRRAIQDEKGVFVHDLYEKYPDMVIDVAHEQALLAKADALIFQHPLYWYSSPAIVKEWIDVVLTHGFAYGAAGKAIAGKPWLQAITAGGKEGSYAAQGFNKFTIAELLRPFEATAMLCGADWRTPFVMHASHLIDDSELHSAALKYRECIKSLRAGLASASALGM